AARATLQHPVVDDVDDVGMTDRVDGLRLGEEAIGDLGIARELGVQDLERDLLADGRVLCEVDGAHAALAQLLRHQIVANGLPDDVVWGRSSGLCVHFPSHHLSSQASVKSRLRRVRVTSIMMRLLSPAFVLWVIVGAFAAPARGDELPDVKSHAAIVIDAATGAEIFGKDADEIRPIASTTKIFVALAVRRKGLDLTGWTEITRADAKQARGGSRTRLDIKEVFRNDDLLRAMLMASDNRAPS